MAHRNKPAGPRPAGAWAIATGLAVALLAATPARAAGNDLSAAEQAIFMTNQLGKLKPPTTLRYSFRKAGSMEEGFVDSVAVELSAQPDGQCCAASGQFLTGARRMALPDVQGAQGNPVTLYFLERDIREMKRLTKGAENYFRKRIRMAVFQGAEVKPATFGYKGRAVAGQEVVISPYLDDPNRFRYEKLAVKEYRFMLSDAVPGGVYGIRTQIGSGATALITEEMLIEGAEPTPGKRAP
jgi:hypothetical protein